MAVVARFVGAKDFEGADHAAAQSLFMRDNLFFGGSFY